MTSLIQRFKDHSQPWPRVGKDNAIWIPDFDQPKKPNILTKAAINGIRAKIKSKIIDFGLQFQVSHSTSPQESTKSIRPYVHRDQISPSYTVWKSLDELNSLLLVTLW